MTNTKMLYVLGAKAYTHPSKKTYVSDVCQTKAEATEILINKLPAEFHDYLRFDEASMREFSTYSDAVRSINAK